MANKTNKLTIREYYLMKLGIAGEITALRAPRLSPFPESSAGRELRRMMKDGLIHYYRTKDGKRMFRLSDPAGYESLEALSPALLAHAEAVVGKKGSRYAGNQKIRAKKSRDVFILETLISKNIPIDGFSDVASLDSSPERHLDYLKILEDTPRDETFFISGAIIKRPAEDEYHTRAETTTTAGTLISPGGIYQTFSPAGSTVRWVPMIETATIALIRSAAERIQGRPKEADPRFRAILYMPGTAELSEMQSRQDERRKLNPTETFKICYAVPKSENAADITEMLTIKDWFFKSCKVLGLTETDTSDGMSPDGTPIYNLLCGNIGRTEDMRYLIENKKAIFIVHDWQKDVIEKAYDSEIEALSLNEKQFAGLVKAVKSMGADESDGAYFR